MTDAFRPSHDDSVVTFLATRRSTPLTQVSGPGPDDGQLRELLRIASRAPDHGRLEPFRFIVYRQQAGAAIGERLAALASRVLAPLNEAELHKERERLLRAPVAVAVVFVPRVHERIPEWEQFLSSGAVALQLVQVSLAHGFAANWVTGWFCDHEEGRAILGLRPEERVAGIVHIGNTQMAVPERPRPDIDRLITHHDGGEGVK